jgi:hypothetical protein
VTEATIFFFVFLLFRPPSPVAFNEGIDVESTIFSTTVANNNNRAPLYYDLLLNYSYLLSLAWRAFPRDNE